MSAKNDEDFDEEDDENKKCPPQDASRSRHKSENQNELHKTTMNACLFYEDQNDKTKCPPHHVTPSNRKEETASHKAAKRHTHAHKHHRDTKQPPKESSDHRKNPPQLFTGSNPEEEMASHKPSKRHTHEHRHHSHTHRKLHSRESSDHHKAVSKKHGVLSEEGEQIKRATDGHVPGSSSNEWRLSDDSRHVVHGFYEQEENKKCPPPQVPSSNLNPSLWDKEENEEIQERDPPDGHIPESISSEWWNRNEAPGTENDLNTKEIINSEVPAMTSADSDMASHLTRPDVSPGVGAVGSQAHPPNNLQRRRWSFPPIHPGAVRVDGPNNEGDEEDGLTIVVGNDEQATIASHVESTVHIIAQAVDMEEEYRRLCEQDQIRDERDMLRQILENAVIVSPVVAANSDVENGDENIHASHDALPRNDDPKCGTRGRRWFAISAILLILVAVVVTLASVLPSEPTPPLDPLSKLLSSASSDGGVALTTPSTPQNVALEWLAGNPNLANYTDQEKIQRYALATLYYTTRGESWKRRDSWLSDAGVCDKWYQDLDSTINCTTDGAVSHLDLRWNNLQGSIPPEIGMLSDSLDFLRLDDNHLVGSIPTEIGVLTKLTTLSIGINTLTGAIPSVIGLLTNLGGLWLYNNELEGNILSEFGELTKLAFLFLDGNKLIGAIPSVIGLLTNLDRLFLDKNSLDGILPTEIGELKKLTDLSLKTNSLTGTIPSELGLLTNLDFLDLSSNQLTSTVPTTLASLSILNFLFLNNNDLTGNLDAFCSMDFDFFVANTCEQDEMNCMCCTHCCYLEGDYQCSLV